MFDELFRSAEKWQGLLGALLGAAMGFVGAFVVAHDARRREERSAAGVLVLNFRRFITFAEVQQQLDDPDSLKLTRNAQGEFEERHVIELFNRNKERLRVRPKVSELFETSMARAMSTDKLLDAHLGSFETAINAMERVLDSIDWEKLYAAETELKKLYRADSLLRQSTLHAQHATRAARCVLSSRVAVIWRLVRRIRRSRIVSCVAGDTDEMAALKWRWEP